MIRSIVRDVRRLLIYMKGAKGVLCAGVVARALSDFLVVWMMAALLGDGVAAYQAGSAQALSRAVVDALKYLVALLALRALASYFIGVATARGTVAMRRQLFGAMMSADLERMHKTHSGQALSYFSNDIPSAMDALVTTLIQPVSGVVMGIGGLAYVLATDARMAWVALGIGAFTLCYSLLFARWLHGIAIRIQALLAELEVKLKDLLDGMVTVRMYGMFSRLERGMAETAERGRREGERWAFASGLLGGMNNAVSYLTDQVLVFAAGLILLTGSIGLAQLMRVSQMAGGIVGIFHLSRLLVSVQKSLAGAQRVFSAIEAARPEPDGEARAPLERAPAVRFIDVHFRYAPSFPLIEGFSLTVQPGRWVAIVGASGSGKSTLLRLIQGLYEPSAGRVEVFGHPVERWEKQALRRDATALIPQEPTLFPGSILSNIALGDEKIDRDRALWAAREAGADGFITAMPGGYDAQVNERGNSLSGGQRQRIAIARALYRDADILLVDEGSSAMDIRSEKEMHEALLRLRGKKTILYVTHRAAAMELADEVVKIGGNTA